MIGIWLLNVAGIVLLGRSSVLTVFVFEVEVVLACLVFGAVRVSSK